MIGVGFGRVSEGTSLARHRCRHLSLDISKRPRRKFPFPPLELGNGRTLGVRGCRRNGRALRNLGHYGQGAAISVIGRGKMARKWEQALPIAIALHRFAGRLPLSWSCRFLVADVQLI